MRTRGLATRPVTLPKANISADVLPSAPSHAARQTGVLTARASSREDGRWGGSPRLLAPRALSFECTARTFWGTFPALFLDRRRRRTSSGTVKRSAMMALAFSVAPVGVADDVGHPPVHHRPGPLRQVGGDDAEGPEMVLAPLDHLDVVDACELGVLLAGGFGGPHKGRAQQRRARLGHRLALRSVSPVSEAFGASPVYERKCLPLRNRPGSPMQATRGGPPTSARPGRLRASAGGSTPSGSRPPARQHP